jgi:ankyrin repeat protein
MGIMAINMDVVQALLEGGADVNLQDTNGTTAMMEVFRSAIRSSEPDPEENQRLEELVELLLRHGWQSDGSLFILLNPNDYGSIMDMNVNVLRMLLDAGADVQAERRGETVMSTLLVNAFHLHQWGQTFTAKEKQRLGVIVHLLIQHGWKGHDGDEVERLVHMAGEAGFKEITAMLRSMGARSGGYRRVRRARRTRRVRKGKKRGVTRRR